MDRRFYLVDAQVLPEVFLKVVRAKELLVELADISPEVVQMAIAPENGEALPGWFVVEAARDIPALARRRNGS